MSPRSAPALRTSRKLGYAVFTVCFLLGGLEVGQRISNHRKWSHRVGKPYTIGVETATGTPYGDRKGSLVMRHTPGLIYSLKPGLETDWIRVNAQGFRGKDWVREKPAGTRRVFLIGGSTAFGLGASCDDATIAAQLERRLNGGGDDGDAGGPTAPGQAGSGRGPRYEVLNAGVWGYHSGQELILLTTQLLDYAPDAIVLFDGWNDFLMSGTNPPGSTVAAPGCFHEIDRILADESRPLLHALRASAFFRSLQNKVPEFLRRHVEDRAYGVYSDNGAVYRAQYRENLERMCRLASAYGVDVLIAPQPELYQRRDPVPEVEQEIRAKKGGDGYREFALDQYPRYGAAAQEVAEQESVAFLDCRAAFDGLDERMFTDAVHLTDRGNARIAEVLAPVVAGLGGR